MIGLGMMTLFLWRPARLVRLEAAPPCWCLGLRGGNQGLNYSQIRLSACFRNCYRCSCFALRFLWALPSCTIFRRHQPKRPLGGASSCHWLRHVHQRPWGRPSFSAAHFHGTALYWNVNFCSSTYS